jgi:hypothetical protein
MARSSYGWTSTEMFTTSRLTTFLQKGLVRLKLFSTCGLSFMARLTNLRDRRSFFVP